MKLPNLVSTLLRKRGVRYEDLTPEEKADVENWKAILQGTTVTIETVKAFCQSEVRRIEERFASQAPSTEDVYLKACLHVYLNILRAIEAPEQEREHIEKYLTQLIK